MLRVGPAPALNGAWHKVLALARTIQRSVSSDIEIAMKGYPQQKDNTCWAAVGRSMTEYYSKSFKTEGAFVKACASDEARKQWIANKTADIDQAIGELSKQSTLLSSSDSAPAFSKAVITKELSSDQPVVLNVETEGVAGSEHYLCVRGKRISGSDWELLIHDPSHGEYWAKTYATRSQAKKRMISKIDNPHGGKYILKVAYYTEAP
jgi:hypothetical protein